jgi:UDP-GlcNAc:undecaprenyl-phosphate/decaprenyl-phosphate GlcNAc-1-phosphate transferase
LAELVVQLWWFFFSGCLVSLLGTGLMLWLAPRVGLIDQPNERKVHARPVPRGGGLAILLACGLTSCCLGPPLWVIPGASLFFALAAGIALLGLVDDWRPLPWQLRLTVQLLAAVAFAVFRLGEHGPVWQVVGVLWLAGLVNAFNMLDNMDALSAGVAWIAAGMFALALLLNGVSLERGSPLPLYAVFMGALTGFLCFNWPPARIFMGDAGSTFVGFFLAARSLEDGFAELAKPWTWAVPVFILAVPCYDLSTVVALRLWQGRSPFHADKQHVSHRLAGLGLGNPAAVRVLYLLGLFSGATGILLSQATPTQARLLCLQVVAVWLAVARIEYVRHFRPPDGPQ